MNSYITTYQGIKLYLVTYNEFVELYEHGMANDGYIISDKKNALIIKDQLIGYIFDGYKKLMPAQIKKPWQEVFNYKKIEVISERPTVEAMATEGSRRLKAVLDEVPVAKASAETKLNELVAEGEKAVKRVIAEGETIRDAIVAEPPVKRKRAPRKRTGGA